jgi:hypothetical protein
VLVGAGVSSSPFIAWLSARRSVRIAEEYLAAREQGERQPALEGRVRLEPSTRRSRRSKFGSLEVKVFNTGKIPRPLVLGAGYDARRGRGWSPRPLRDWPLLPMPDRLWPHLELPALGLVARGVRVLVELVARQVPGSGGYRGHVGGAGLEVGVGV